METNDLFKNATLCALETHSWGNTKKIPIEMIKKITNKKISNWIRTNKNLIDKDALSDINSIITKAINTVRAYSLPFPIRSIFLVPNDSVVELSEELDEVIEMMEKAKEELAEEFDELISSAKEELGEDFWNKNDYPKDIKSRFGIEYKFVQLSVSEHMKEISPKLYKEEQEKFKNLMEQTKHECVLYLREGFVKVLESMVETLTGKNDEGGQKRIRQDAIERIERFFESFQNKNIFGDNQLQEIVQKARDTMFGFSSEDFKNNETLRTKIADQMENLQEELQKSVTKYRRKIIL